MRNFPEIGHYATFSSRAPFAISLYREKVTGARPDRRELNRIRSSELAPGNVVTVTRIDRPARSTFDLFAIVKRVADAKVRFRSLAEPWAYWHQHRALDAGGFGRACRCSRRPTTSRNVARRGIVRLVRSHG